MDHVEKNPRSKSKQVSTKQTYLKTSIYFTHFNNMTLKQPMTYIFLILLSLNLVFCQNEDQTEDQEEIELLTKRALANSLICFDAGMYYS